MNIFYKNALLTVSVLTFSGLISNSIAQNVGVNATGATPNASAMLDVASTTGGLLLPRMTEAQKNAIPTPATGLLVYQTDVVSGFYYYDGIQWRFLYSNEKEVYLNQGTGSVTVTNATWQLVPGLTRTITLNAPAKVRISSDGGIQNTGGANSNSIVDVAFYLNGSLVISTYGGGFRRLVAINVNFWTGIFEYWSMESVMNLAAGTYTIEVLTRKNGGSNAAVGGTNGQVMHPVLVTEVMY